MKYVTIHLRDRSEITVTLEQAEKILESDRQIIKINDKDGQWRGDAINKADIMRTERNIERERQEKRHSGNKELPQEATGDSAPADISQFKPDFMKQSDEKNAQKDTQETKKPYPSD